MHAARWAGTLLVATIFLRTEALAKPPAIPSGPLRCGINGYMWPRSVDAGPTPTVVGTVETVPDGHGKFISGEMTQHLADDTHLGGSNVCNFGLESGTYIQNSDDTVTNTIVWKLLPGSDSHCGATVTDSKNLGYTEGARDFRGFKNTSTSYILDDGRIAWVGASPQGVGIGVCEPVKK
jgi:hypothetical protein